jgi:hypothetical protein
MPVSMKVDDSSRVYGQDNPACGVSYDGFVLDQDADVLGGVLEFATNATKTSSVGDYDVAASGLTSGNYAIGYTMGTLNVSKAPLTITANDATKLYRASNPSLSGEVTGLKNGDQVTVSYSTAATADSPVGSYPITPAVTGVSTANYDIRLVAGTLKVMYGWDGFLQPINDTAHQTGVQESRFKLGQTTPAKFVIKDAAGNVVQQAAPKFSISGNRGPCGAGSELETVGALTSASTQFYAWTGSQHQYSWSTKGLTAGEYRLWTNLADGNTMSYVDICLTK